MKALFFVYTPFQFFVAQQIVSQEKLRDSVAVVGYVGNNAHFLDIYEFMNLEKLWKKKYVMTDLPHWDGLTTRTLNDVRKAYSNYTKLKSIAKDNNIDSIFISDHQNQSSRFAAIVFSHLGYRIAFYEEGLAHYVNRAFVEDKSFRFKIKILLRDIFYYLPIYHVNFAKWRYQVNKPLDDTFPMDCRYSIIPIFKGEKEFTVTPIPVISDNVRDYINKIIKHSDDGSKVLILTDPLEEIYSEVERFGDLYLESIRESIEGYTDEVTVYVKFHPREKQITCENIKKMLESMRRKYIILSENINLPVELFLQAMNFDKIFFYCTSTFAYNGFLFPKQEFVCLLPELNEKCVRRSQKEFAVANNILSFFNGIESLFHLK